MPTPKQRNITDSLTVMQVLPALKVGGVERGTIELAIYLKQQGHRPIVVSAGGDLVAELVNHDIKHIKLNVGRKSLMTLGSIKPLRKLIQSHQVDVVHARSRLPAWLCYWALRKLGSNRPKFVTTLHGLHSVSRYSSIMARGDAVIAVSETARDYLNQNFKAYLSKQPELIYRGKDPQFSFGHQANPDWLQQWLTTHGLSATNQKVLLPGRLTRLKGVEHLIPWLSKSSPQARLLLTAKPEESAYSQQVAKLFEHQGLSDRVVWLGIERNMPDLYAAVDVVVSTNNKAESFGRTVLEALSIGTPVVGFAHGGVAEVMSAIFSAGLVPNGDDQTLAEKIDAFLGDAPKVQSHELFTNQSMFEQTLAVYQQVVAA